uniref:Uncharacterized protein n=1 Tax=Arundo donax TaxID=35708 RepID=A0A0A8Y6B7_ARUDO
MHNSKLTVKSFFSLKLVKFRRKQTPNL